KIKKRMVNCPGKKYPCRHCCGASSYSGSYCLFYYRRCRPHGWFIRLFYYCCCDFHCRGETCVNFCSYRCYCFACGSISSRLWSRVLTCCNYTYGFPTSSVRNFKNWTIDEVHSKFCHDRVCECVRYYDFHVSNRAYL